MQTDRTLWLNIKTGLRLGFEALLICALLAPILSDLITYIQATWAGEPYRAGFLGNLIAYILFFVLFLLCYIVPFLISGIALPLMGLQPSAIKIAVVAVMSVIGSLGLNKVVATGVGDTSRLLPFYFLILLIQAFLFLRPRHHNAS